MSNKPRNQRRIRVRGIRRAKPDMRKLSRALIMLAQSQAEKDAETQHRRQPQHKRKRDDGD